MSRVPGGFVFFFLSEPVVAAVVVVGDVGVDVDDGEKGGWVVSTGRVAIGDTGCGV